MRRNTNDAIMLDRNGLIVLFVVLAVAFVLAAVIGVKPKEEDIKPIEIDVEIEVDTGAVEYELLSAENTPADMPDGREIDIAIPCSLDRRTLIATMKSALLQSHIEHSYKSCHRVRVFLDGLWPSVCSPVAQGYLCKKACEGGLNGPGWDFQIHLAPRSDWPDMDDASLVQMCTYLARTQSCPWLNGFDEQKSFKKLTEELSLSPSEAQEIITKGKKLGSVDGYFRQNLRQRNY